MVRRDPSHFYLIRVLVGLGEAVLHLEAKPHLRTGTEGLRKPYRHLRRNSGLGVHQIIESLALDTESLRGLRDRKTQWLDALLPHNLAGMRGVLHTHAIEPPNGSRSNPHPKRGHLPAEDHPPIRPEDHAPKIWMARLDGRRYLAFAAGAARATAFFTAAVLGRTTRLAGASISTTFEIAACSDLNTRSAGCEASIAWNP